MGISASPSNYAGQRFRQRLDGTWAAFFDLVGWPWEYQPESFSGFVPTFRLDLHRPLYVVVDSTVGGYEHRAFAVAASIGVPRLLVLGQRANWAGTRSSTIGLIASEDTYSRRDDMACDLAELAELATCTECDRFTLFPESQPFTCQGWDAHEGGSNRHCLSGDDLAKVWLKAQPGLAPLRSLNPPKQNPYNPFVEDAA